MDKVVNWFKFRILEDVRRFFGFVGYYRRFIENFSRICRLLIDLMFLFFKKKIKGKNRQIREWYWGVEQDKVFEILKIYLVLVLILGYVDSILLYELYIDVLGDFLGVVLYQE